MKPWADDRYEMSRGGPSGEPILITVHSCLEKAELSRLGRRLSSAVTVSFSFPFALALLLGEADGDEGEGELE